MPPAPRVRHSRTRAGCLTCRTRKKKCDEVKPRCAGCRRNQVACEWPPDVSDSPGSDSHQPGHQHGSLAHHPAPRMQNAATMQHAATHLPLSTTVAPAIPVLHSGDERACGLTPQSTLLLRHYLCHTASYFAMRTLEDNPFVNVLLPLGYTDDLLMHGLLALSGAHLAYKEPNSTEVASATRMHYSKMISGLRSEFSNLQDDQLEKRERLLRVLMVACHYEVVSGDTQGAMFIHLRSSRHLIMHIIAHRDTTQPWDAIGLSALGFSIEIYAYLMLYNTIVPSSITLDPADAFVMSLEEMAPFPTFGALFAGSHELFQLLAQISQLASRRLAEEAAGSTVPTAALKNIHDDLQTRLTSWRMPPPHPGESLGGREYKSFAAETLRQGLYIYLTTALSGSTVNMERRTAVDGHVRLLFGHAQGPLASRYYVANMVWPIVIAGTCLVKPGHQQALKHEMGTKEFNLRNLKNLGDILQLLWDDPDPRAYGPYGLYMIMEKHGQTVGIV